LLTASEMFVRIRETPDWVVYSARHVG
jgi:hypothetical protein